ncbi:hypothetical protein DMB66_55400 [Actinoplanes sp. ATCC 53533]|uniref:hypothetical protein n=1 Tax=Actinoplanes sp. ATCC 53533 TaxID=1288362 RepID=UPI000F7B96DA|nr:hypothetical protein [Actinoplanes sp. ATCC 53533]RSM41953.1 hypothetical protein DMB66_55400 [Actinoplanes sp. ATCC 53533]
MTGDLDLDTVTTLRHHLAGDHAGRFDPNLSAVEFCDLAGRDTLRAFGRAVDSRHQVRITAVARRRRRSSAWSTSCDRWCRTALDPWLSSQ